MNSKNKLSRRDFLKVSALALGGLAMSNGKIGPSLMDGWPLFQEEELVFPENVNLGRMCIGSPGANTEIRSEPSSDAPIVGTAWFDDVFEWRQEVMASPINPYLINQRWVETEKGYIYAENLQRVRYEPQVPLTDLPIMESGERGMWVEIVSPYTSMTLTKAQSSYQYWIRETIKPRVYYSQVFWAFDVRENPATGNIEYCLMQRYGAFPDTYWVDATVCRRITPEEISPINPGAENKRIVVNLLYQTLSCFEGSKEVFFTKICSGYPLGDGKWLTPVGLHTIWWKLLSVHMSAGSAVGDYDVSGIPWSTFFGNNGEAIHSTYWHNKFGFYGSHGCVNARPEDAKWIWRWTEPAVPYETGEVTISGLNKSTQVEVVAG